MNKPQYTEAQLAAFKTANAEGMTYNGRHYTKYKATQKQRQIERSIRTQKRRILIDEETKDSDKLLTDRIRLVRLNDEYKRFSKAAGLREQVERAQLEGFGSRDMSMAAREAERYYVDWSKSAGINNSIKTLANYYDVKYNDFPRYRLLQGYVRAVEKRDISPLVGFEEYERVSNEVSSKIVGVTAKNGVTIESFATHFIDRVIGQTSTPHKGMRRGVSIDNVLDTLLYPEKLGKVRNLPDGDIRQTLIGKTTDVTISIRDKRLIQTNPND